MSTWGHTLVGKLNFRDVGGADEAPMVPPWMSSGVCMCCHSLGYLCNGPTARITGPETCIRTSSRLTHGYLVHFLYWTVPQTQDDTVLSHHENGQGQSIWRLMFLTNKGRSRILSDSKNSEARVDHRPIPFGHFLSLSRPHLCSLSPGIPYLGILQA